MTHPIPSAALDDRLGFTGNTGSGKTYSSGTAVERLLHSGARVVIPDPLGVWWGLALSSDGKKPSVFRKRADLIIFGGPRGDLPLNEYAGALVGETVAGMKESCIIDLSELGTKAAERRFMLAFLGALYKHKTSTPLHVIFDEADMWAPQRILDKEGEAMKLLGMMETICRRGRIKGFIPWLITQRPAVLSKNVLSQIDGLIAFKLTSVQDRDAIGDWVEGQADKAQWKALWAKMATLERGQGVVWIPGRDILRTTQFPKKETFDSSRAPKRGERAQRTKALKPVNIEKLKARLSKVEAETKANDPKLLRVQIAEKNREIARLSAKPVSGPAIGFAVRAAEGAAYTRGKIDGYGEAIKSVRAEYASVASAIDAIEVKFKNLKASAEQVTRWADRAAKKQPKTITPRPTAILEKVIRKAMAPPEIGDATYTGPQMKVLRSLAMWRSLGHERPSRAQVAAVAGYSASSGGFANLLGSLSQSGSIIYPAPGYVALNVEGIDVMGQHEGAAMLISVLKNPQKKIVSAITDGEIHEREAVANAAGYSPTSGGFANLLGSLSTLGIIVYPAPRTVQLESWAHELLQDARLAA